MSSGCRKCGKPAYIKPDGSAAFLCPDCIMEGLEDLGIFPKKQAVEHSVQRTCLQSPDGEHHFEPGESLIICAYCGASR